MVGDHADHLAVEVPVDTVGDVPVPTVGHRHHIVVFLGVHHPALRTRE